jgi:oligoribonuclease
MSRNLLLWIDIETTGLDYVNDKILQIACVLTDFELKFLNIFPELTLCCDTYTLNNMSDWCKVTHQESGLIEKCKNSNITLKEAEMSIINNINHFVGMQDTLYIAGNSVHFDKRFIDIQMPELSRRLSHRILDVSSFALVFKNLNLLNNKIKIEKTYNHTAQSDILESINEYKQYLDYMTNTNTKN